jgi:hypothetical protein
MTEVTSQFKINCQGRSPISITIGKEDTVLDLKNKLVTILLLTDLNFILIQNSTPLDDKQTLLALPKLEATLVFKKKPPKSHSTLYWVLGAAVLIGGILIWKIKKVKQ